MRYIIVLIFIALLQSCKKSVFIESDVLPILSNINEFEGSRLCADWRSAASIDSVSVDIKGKKYSVLDHDLVAQLCADRTHSEVKLQRDCPKHNITISITDKIGSKSEWISVFITYWYKPNNNLKCIIEPTTKLYFLDMNNDYRVVKVENWS